MNNDADTGADTVPERAHHERYYFEDNAVFLVENTLFRVPRYMFIRKSRVFETMFSLPSGMKVAEGTTDASPVHLQDVKSVDFERLLGFLYPLTTEFRTFTDHWKEAEWMSILRLSHMWMMADIRSLAINNLQNISPMKKILSGRQFDHPPWVKEGLTSLCLRAEPLSEEEGCELGLKDVVRCAAAREKIRQQVYGTRTGNVPPWSSWAPPRVSKQSDDELSGGGFARVEYRKSPKVEQIVDEIFGYGTTKLPVVPGATRLLFDDDSD